jgi:hypothetical protein
MTATMKFAAGAPLTKAEDQLVSDGLREIADELGLSVPDAKRRLRKEAPAFLYKLQAMGESVGNKPGFDFDSMTKRTANMVGLSPEELLKEVGFN